MTNAKIEKTKAFKQLSDVNKIINSKSSMMKEVKREFEIAKTIGIEEYKTKYSPRPYKLNVITELLTNN